MNPQEELLKEVITAISLYKESLEMTMAAKTTEEALKAYEEVYEARKHLYSFLETPQYED